MKRKFAFLLVLVGILILAVVGVKFIGGRTKKQGVLKVQSTPVAGVFLDNKSIGRTPFEQKTDAGEYTIKLTPDTTVGSVSSWQGTIRVGPSLLTYINGDLAESEFATAVDILWLERITSRESELAVTTNPDGTTIVVDNETKGIAPISFGLKPGDHTLIVTSPGFVTRTVKIKTTAGYKLNANIKMALSPGGDINTDKEATPSPTGKITPTGTPKTTLTKTATSSAIIPDPPKPFVIIKDTPTGYLRVRDDATVGAKELGRVNPGEKYTFFDSKTASGSSTLWYQIKYDGKNSGWVSGQYLEKVE